MVLFMMTFGSILITSDVIWFVEYETYWAFLISMLALYATGRAGVEGEDSPWFKCACIVFELSTCFNFMVTILFWTILAPIIYPNLPDSADGVWIGIRLFIVHV